MKDPTFDRRKYPRIRTEALVSIAQLGFADQTVRTLDLSPGGLRFQCVALDLEIGELLRVDLNLGGERISVVGKVVRATDLGAFEQELALALVEVEAGALEHLCQYLEVSEL